MRRLLAGAMIAAGLAAALGAARRLDAVAVRGRSMAPTLLPGDRLIVARRHRAPRVGDVVVVRDPRGGGRELVKRVASVGPDGVTVLGDHAADSTDARVFGTLPVTAVGWRAVLRYWPPSRFGPVPSSISTGSDSAAHELSGSPSRQR